MNSNFTLLIFMKRYIKIAGFPEIVEYPSFEAALCEKILESNRNRAWMKIEIPL